VGGSRYERVIEGVRLIKTKAKLCLTMNKHLNNEGQEYKTGHVKEKVLVGGRVNEEGKQGQK
jgi:hypothetical protein